MNAEDSLSAPDLWSFSVNLYGSAGVKEACLSLQSNGALDVCVLLTACWSAEMKWSAWSQADVSQILHRTEAWRKNVVLPLRAVRDYLKTFEAPNLRNSVLDLELSAERAQLDMMAALLQGEINTPSSGDCEEADVAAANLSVYLDAAERAEPIDRAALEPDLGVLIDAAFPVRAQLSTS